MPNSVFVSIIIPCRNEEKYISRCLDSVIANDYPKDKLEILVIDGMSEDATSEIVRAYAQRHSFIRVLCNSKKITSVALNMGVRCAKGEIIMRMDAHTTYEIDYVLKCIEHLHEYDIDNVGGICKVTPSVDTLTAKGIALVLSHPFGVGNSYFRIGPKEPKLVDTVPFGCYERKIFERIGLFNEDLIRNQDLEFNLRLRRANGKILLAPGIVSYYHTRSNLKGLFGQNFWNGFWVIYSNRFAKVPFSLRHLVPFVFVLSFVSSLFLSAFWQPFSYIFLAIIGAYLTANMFFSLGISRKNGLRLFPSIVISFFVLHFSYGLGSLWGLIKLILPSRG